MNQPSHQQYYVTRAEVSRSLARKAASPMIAMIHQDFAVRYDAIASRLDGNDEATGGAQPA